MVTFNCSLTATDKIYTLFVIIYNLSLSYSKHTELFRIVCFVSCGKRKGTILHFSISNSIKKYSIPVFVLASDNFSLYSLTVTLVGDFSLEPWKGVIYAINLNRGRSAHSSGMESTNIVGCSFGRMWNKNRYNEWLFGSVPAVFSLVDRPPCNQLSTSQKTAY